MNIVEASYLEWSEAFRVFTRGKTTYSKYQVKPALVTSHVVTTQLRP
ncbi:hypothetical protein SAMN04515618_103207 [Collimonas sp. OK307]|nr:hypothetical protein SAMN04515618_103207 [Collimonas sp. OK307]